jgi:23S rRNA (cytidine1920-2'-O)/16S rRNA (cytidine1409-2'-O)-methyltransferase
MKLRLDKLIFERGLAPSRERAQSMVLAGRILVNEQKVEKSGAQVSEDVEIRVIGEDQKYVSRGGIKLEHALNHWHIDLKRKLCADIGTSTGGFTDVMLQHGASSVISVDTGYGQIAEILRKDRRVILMEKTNARHLTPHAFHSISSGIPLDFVAMDVSFISATLVLPAVLKAAFGDATDHHGELVVLIKPQFEVGREHVGKGGIVKNNEHRKAAVDKVFDTVKQLGGINIATIESPITGAEGNVEYLLHAVWH